MPGKSRIRAEPSTWGLRSCGFKSCQPDIKNLDREIFSSRLGWFRKASLGAERLTCEIWLLSPVLIGKDLVGYLVASSGAPRGVARLRSRLRQGNGRLLATPQQVRDGARALAVLFTTRPNSPGGCISLLRDFEVSSPLPTGGPRPRTLGALVPSAQAPNSQDRPGRVGVPNVEAAAGTLAPPARPAGCLRGQSRVDLENGA